MPALKVYQSSVPMLQVCRHMTIIKIRNFYAELRLLTKFPPKHVMEIIKGDWNARVSHNAAAMTSTVGKYGIGDRCANGKRLLHYDLFVINNCFRHRVKHLVTWNSLDNQHFNQKIIFYISRCWKN